MALFGRRPRRDHTASGTERENRDFAPAFTPPGGECTRIGSCIPRQRARVCGEVVALHQVTTPAEFGAEISDGTGNLILTWLGRFEVPGFEVGRRVVAAGTVGRSESGHLRITEPRYTLWDT